MKRSLTIAAFLLAICLYAGDPPNFSSLDQVLQTFSDSRKTRDLKIRGSELARKTFTETLYNQVYKPVDAAVVRHAQQLPEYQGKKIIVHDFRTPGADSKRTNVNTDRDVRLLVEVEPNRWVEIPAKKWRNTYYREFAKHTGGPANGTVEACKQHAERRFRQLPTDQFHAEASHDYADQTKSVTYERGADGKLKRVVRGDSTISVSRGANGETVVASRPNMLDVKDGTTTLGNAESLSQMYQMKSVDQLNEAAALREQLAEPDVELTEPQRAALQDQAEMFEAEGAAQARKGVETFDAVRQGYIKQGYDVGELPEQFQKGAEIIKNIDGSSSTDVEKMNADLKQAGFRDLNDFVDKMSGQMESLKLARPKKPPKLKLPSLKTVLHGAGKAAGYAGDAMSIKQRLDEARNGSHLFINFEDDDSTATKALKGTLVAALELYEVPVIDALERGWKYDELEKQYILQQTRDGKAVNPVGSFLRVSGPIVFETVKGMTVDPIIQANVAQEEGVKLVKDVFKNWQDDSIREATDDANLKRHTEHLEKAIAFDLGVVVGRRGSFTGRSLLFTPVEHGELLCFEIEPNANWTEAYTGVWELSYVAANKSMKKTLMQYPDLKAAGTPRVSFRNDNFPARKYKVTFRVFSKATGKQIDFSSTEFEAAGTPGLGNLKATLETFDGKAFEAKAPLGSKLAFQVRRIGTWDNSHRVQWFLGAQKLKDEPADDPKIHLLRFPTKDWKPRTYKVSVRMLDADEKIVAARKHEFRLAPPVPELAEFKLAGSVGKPPEAITEPVTAGDTLTFQAAVPHPKAKQAIPSRLVWQLYDAQKKPLPRFAKEVRALEAGKTVDYRFSFKVAGLENGRYILALTHQLITDPEVFKQAQFPFDVFVPVRLTRALMATDAAGKKPCLRFVPGQDVYGVIELELGKGIDAVDVKLALRSGKAHVGGTPKRVQPKAGERTAHASVRLPAKAVQSGAPIAFEIEVELPDGKSIRKILRAAAGKLEIRLIAPGQITAGRNAKFRVVVPDGFAKPVRIDVNTTGALGFVHTKNATAGKLTSFAKKRSAGDLIVTVRDAAGRKATARKRIGIVGRAAVGKNMFVEQNQVVRITGKEDWTDIAWHQTYYPGTRIVRDKFQALRTDSSKLHGKFIRYYKSGKVWGQVNAVHGFFQGKGVRYLETGEKLGEGTFVDGQFHGAVVAYFYKTNQVWTKWIYQHGILQSMTTWHSNGRIACRSSSYDAQGRQHGAFKWYDRNGRHTSTSYFSHGRLTRTQDL